MVLLHDHGTVIRGTKEGFLNRGQEVVDQRDKATLDRAKRRGILDHENGQGFVFRF